MALDVWIYGPGFGESILLVWDSVTAEGRPVRQAAFIDCYGSRHPDGHPALCQWSDEGEPEVALVAITHPHLDHIRHAAIVMSAAGYNAPKILWWGGHGLRRIRAFFHQLSEDDVVRGRETGVAARMAKDFLDRIDFLERGLHPEKPGVRSEVATPMELDLVFTGQSAEGPIRFHAISPWLGPQTAYVDWINSQIRTVDGRTEVCPRKGVANCTSMGFLIEYGSAQVLLGGDMESDNWAEVRAAWQKRTAEHQLPPMRPCLIKVSHHGSINGTLPAMWEQGRGFFGSMDDARANPPQCIITPWRRGNSRRHLPDPEVVGMISHAGCHVWETATAPELIGIDRPSRPCGSYIRLSVDPHHNRAKVLTHNYCRHTPPQL